MKTLFKSEAISKGGRSGALQSSDGFLDIALGNPLEKGIETHNPNPEQLFAGAYSACYQGALVNAGKKLGTPVKTSTVRALLSQDEHDKHGYGLAVELHALIPDMRHEQVQCLMEEANQTCPYSRALQGTASVTLVVD